MNSVATLLVLAALNVQAPAQPSTAAPARQAPPGIMLAQAGTPPPGPMNPPSTTPQVAPPSVGAPAPTPKIDELPDGPPLGSLSLSQLMLRIEGEPEFAYVREVDWRDGRYAVTYVTRDGQSHEKMIDPRTGRASQARPQTGAGGAPDDDAGRTGEPGGPVSDSPGRNPPAYNPSGTPSTAPSTAPRPSGPTR